MSKYRENIEDDEYIPDVKNCKTCGNKFEPIVNESECLECSEPETENRLKSLIAKNTAILESRVAKIKKQIFELQDEIENLSKIIKLNEGVS